MGDNLDVKFNEAAENFGKLATDGKLTNDEKLEGYGLFKQATIGDNNTGAPGFISTPETKAKWNAWESRKGLSKEEAKQKYIELTNSLQAKQ